MQLVRAAQVLLSSLVAVGAHSLPPPTGQYHVALTQHVLDHITPNDPFAPNNTGTSILLSIYYPTLQAPTKPRKYIDDGLAVYYETYFGWPSGYLSNITTNLQWQAPTLPAHEQKVYPPTLLFGPAFAGPPTQCWTALISDLVSHGYTVVGIDHPYEQPFLQYPYGGPGIPGLAVDFEPTDEQLELTSDYRITDTVAFLNAYPKLVAEYNAPFNTEEYIVFGHSLGGSAAMGELIEIKKPSLLGGINIDGSIFGVAASNDSKKVDIKTKPIMFLESSQHFAIDDTSWDDFFAAQTGWWENIGVQGTNHSDFSDTSLWKQWYGVRVPGPGITEAYKVANITRGLVSAFFDFVITGKPQPLLQKAPKKWPEIVYLNGSTGHY